MPKEVASRVDLARITFDNAGREITQVFSGIGSNMALAAGTLAAILAVLGAGELFGTSAKEVSAGTSANEISTGIPRLSSVSLVILASAAPLIWRFFVRTVTNYQNLLRFLELQREAWRYLTGRRTWEAFERYVDLYFLDWRSPQALHRLMWSNLKYGYFAIFAVALAALIWSFVTAIGVTPRIVAGIILLLAVIWEGTTLWSYKREFYRLPSEAELEELRQLQCEVPAEAPATTAPSPPRRFRLFGFRVD